jgi:biopolymer transport protein ExbB
VSKGLPETKPTEVGILMIEILIKGGPVMIPLLFCSVLAVAVGLERVWYLFRSRADSKALMDEVRLSLDAGRPLEAINYLKQVKSPVAAVLATGLAYSDQNENELRLRLKAAGEEQLFKMQKRLPILETVVSLSPLLGLLGTVTGIIRSFNVLSNLQGVSDPTALSAGIAEALITTAAGLIIAIPTLAVYNWLTSIIEKRLQEMNTRAEELIDLIEIQGEV